MADLKKKISELNKIPSVAFTDEIEISRGASSWSATLQKVYELFGIASKMEQVPTAPDGNLSEFDDAGQVVDSSVPTSQILDNSDDIDAAEIAIVDLQTGKIDTVPTATEDNISVFDSEGEVKDSSVPILSIANLQEARVYTGEPTGFTNNENIGISYSSTTRKVTLTGTYQAFYQGSEVAELANGWESEAHADIEDNYFLLYNGTSFEFATGPVDFGNLFICYIQYNTQRMAIRETHGFMPRQTHAELHEVIGTYMSAGGDLTEYILDSNTVADRRPYVSNTTVNDEDLRSIIGSLTSGLYTHRYLTGASVRSLDPGQTDIINLSGSQPYWNENIGGVWQQSLFTANYYGAIFIVGIPTTSDAESQQFRYMFVQPQEIFSTLLEAQLVNPSGLTHGDSTALVSEFVFFSRVVIQYKSGNWQIKSVQKLTGTKIAQVATPAGDYLSTVAVDGETITGDGKTSNPLFATGVFYNIAKTFKAILGVENLLANQTFSFPKLGGLLSVFGMLETFLFGGQAHSGFNTEAFSAAITFDTIKGNNQEMAVTAATTIGITDSENSGEIRPGTYVFCLPIDSALSPTITVGASFGDPIGGGAFNLNDTEHNILTLLVSASGEKLYTITSN